MSDILTVAVYTDVTCVDQSLQCRHSLTPMFGNIKVPCQTVVRWLLYCGHWETPLLSNEVRTVHLHATIFIQIFFMSW